MKNLVAELRAAIAATQPGPTIRRRPPVWPIASRTWARNAFSPPDTSSSRSSTPPTTAPLNLLKAFFSEGAVRRSCQLIIPTG